MPTSSETQHPAGSFANFPGALVFGLVAVVIALAFGWTLDGYFVCDDFAYVGRYIDFPLSRWPALLVRGWADGLSDPPMRELRPLHALTFILDGQLWHANPLGYRITNLLLHASAATAVGAITWHVSDRNRAAAIFAALLFALHPVQAEPVSWITARGDLLATCGLLLALLFFLRHRREGGNRWVLLALTAHAAALGAKESAIIVALFWLAADLTWLRPGSWRNRDVWLPYAGAALVLAAYFFCRHLAFEVGALQSIGAGPPELANSGAHLQLAQRQAGYVAHLFPPLDSPVRSWRAGTFGRDDVIVALVTAAAFGLGLVWLLRRWLCARPARDDRRAALFFGAGWYLAATVPLAMTYFSPRHLYPAVAGLVIFFVLVLRGALPRGRIFALACSALALAEAGLLVQRLRPWHEAALLAGRATTAIRELEREHPHGPLIVDVPSHFRGAFCWWFAAPHVFRPPFTTHAVDRDRPVIAPPATQAYQHAWRDPALLEALQRATEDGWLVAADASGTILVQRISAEALRREATRLKFDATVLPASDAWMFFIRNLKTAEQRARRSGL